MRLSTKKKFLNYYLEDEQNLDKVLDILFELMMAGRNLLFRFVDVFLTVHWSDARKILRN